MIRLHFSPPEEEPGWQSWVSESNAALLEVFASTSKPRIKSELYKRMRDVFLTVSSKKCAYCEAMLTDVVRKGDVEHYRPKGRVRDERGNIVRTANAAGVDEDHPGYYWLAYDWRNLLPACPACNRRACDTPSGQQTGKGEIFPTLDGWWATKPEDIDKEQPALLNPYFDDPNEHLVFDVSTGIVGYKTRRGKITIQVLGLNRDGLPEARRIAAENASELYAGYIQDRLLGREDPRRLSRMRMIDVGSAEYDAVCLSTVFEAWTQLNGGQPVGLPPGLTARP